MTSHSLHNKESQLPNYYLTQLEVCIEHEFATYTILGLQAYEGECHTQLNI